MANLKVKACHFVVSVDVYQKDIVFFFGYNHRQMASILSSAKFKSVDDFKQMLEEYEDDSYRGISFTDDKGKTLIAMPVVPSTCEEHGTLVHEIFHAVEGIMGNIGNHHGDDFNESWAYLIGYLTKEALLNLAPYYP